MPTSFDAVELRRECADVLDRDVMVAATPEDMRIVERVSEVAGHVPLLLDAIDQLSAWQPVAAAPSDINAAAVICRLRCCQPGALLMAVASRSSGIWTMPVQHDCDVEMWLALPALPAILLNQGTKQ